MSSLLPPDASTTSPLGAGARLPIAGVWLASSAVLCLALLASFRLPLGQDPGALVAANGPRVLLGAGAGALVALAGALRQLAGGERPLRELALFAGAVGAAAGGYGAAGLAPANPVAAFALGAAAGALLGGGLARALERPARWTNLGASLLLPAGIGLAAVVGSYARAGDPLLARAVTWLLGDLSGAAFASGAVLAGVALVLCAAALRTLARGSSGANPGAGVGSATRSGSPALLGALAFGVSFGAVGPLAFVGSLAPRAVRALARGTGASTFAAASAAAGAATVVAVDAVPRLLVGGYDFPWNVPAGILALPIFLGWNRARLRQAVGPASLAFEVLELGLIAALSLGAALVALFFTEIVRSAT